MENHYGPHELSHEFKQTQSHRDGAGGGLRIAKRTSGFGYGRAC
jgi:hypothetical protein